MQLLATAILVVSLFISTGAQAAPQFRVALIADGPSEEAYIVEKVMVEELIALTKGEFDLSIERYHAGWTLSGVIEAFDRAYANPEIDMLLVSGIAANQLGVARDNFPKPTFLPVVFDVELTGAPLAGDVSGKKNLSYLTSGIAFRETLQNFLRVAPVQKIALLSDQLIISAIPKVADYSRKLANEEGVELSFIGHDGSNHDLAPLIPADVDGVLMAAFPRMPDPQLLTLIEQLNDLKLPSFSLMGSGRVAKGMLVTDVPSTDWSRQARRNALNMQAVMLGEQAGDLPVLFKSKHQLTINMATARKIGLSPRFDVLSEAVLLNKLPEAQGPLYGLVEVARLALARNLQLNAESYGVDAGQQTVRTARAALLPQITLGAGYTKRKQSLAVRSGQLAEEATDGSVNLSQLVYSDSAWANLQIQQQLQHSRQASFEQSRLEIIQSATIAYLNVLRAQTQLRVRQDNLNLTKTNLELARDRVRVGASSSADVYRWETRIASDRSSLLQATAVLNQTRENLNRILHRPITEPFQAAAVRKGDPFAMSTDEFDTLVNNWESFQFFTEFMLQKGFDLAPELVQLEAQLAAKKREITNRTRAYWLPDFSLSGRFGENFNQAGLGVGPSENESDWNLSINASLPLFDGGSRRAELSRARLELMQLQSLYDSAREQIEQQVRANIHDAFASYANIELSEQAASSGRKNLELVTDAYAKGVVSIIDLLDAQNASLQADEAAANSVYDFLIDIMNVQRSTGLFDFMLSQAEQDILTEDFRAFLRTRNGARGQLQQ